MIFINIITEIYQFGMLFIKLVIRLSFINFVIYVKRILSFWIGVYILVYDWLYMNTAHFGFT